MPAPPTWRRFLSESALCLASGDQPFEQRLTAWRLRLGRHPRTRLGSAIPEPLRRTCPACTSCAGGRRWPLGPSEDQPLFARGRRP